MSAAYLQERYTPANLAALRRDIRAARHSAALEAQDPYYPRDMSAGVASLETRLHELRDVAKEGGYRRGAVLHRVNQRRHYESIGCRQRAAMWGKRTLDLLRAGNIDGMYGADPYQFATFEDETHV